LTSITQADVDSADPFPEVLERHTAWLRTHGLTQDNALFVTCGDWDLKRMLPNQLRASELKPGILDPLYRRWLNIKVLYAEVLGLNRAGGMRGMLRGLGLELGGHHHRGIDDCRNITNILLALLDRGGQIQETGRS
jgi:ERI1 exoribonuclease 3